MALCPILNSPHHELMADYHRHQNDYYQKLYTSIQQDGPFQPPSYIQYKIGYHIRHNYKHYVEWKTSLYIEQELIQ